MAILRKLTKMAAGTALVILLGPLPAGAGTVEPKLRKALQEAMPGEAVRVIVRMADGLDLERFRGRDERGRSELVRTLQERSDRAQRDLQPLLEKRGIKRSVRLWAINGLALAAPPEVVAELALQPGVERISLDELVRAPIAAAAAAAIPEWNLAAIRVPELWDLGHTGVGAVVAGIDTGVDVRHPDLARTWRGGTNSWFDPNGEHATPYDAAGHGTQTIGVAIGGSAGGSAIGVAPGARWIAVKIFNDAGMALLSRIHEGFQWVLDPDGDPNTDDAPDVVSNSWYLSGSAGQCIPEFESDLQVLRAADIAVVFSAGNNGPNPSTDTSPANNPGNLAVGAVDQAQNVAYFSSRGPSACDGSLFPAVVAPGIDIRTADLTFGGSVPASYTAASGTSFAAPHVAGAIALLRSALPGTPVGALEQALANTARDLGLPGPDHDSGHGLIDVFAAYRQLAPAPACTDADADGFFVEAECGTPRDCSDGDPVIHPGAAEIGYDGIDQDCNGYDLTIAVVKAAYDAQRDVLYVEATSSLGVSAGLKVGGYGEMRWVRKQGKWTLTARRAGNPEAVTVSGVEGMVSVPLAGGN